MSAVPILLVGAGGHAQACIDVVEAHSGFRIAGLIGSPAEVGQTVLGYPVIGADPDLDVLRSEITSALVAVGQIRSPDARIRLFDRLRGLGYKLPAVVSPAAYVSRHARIGAGTIVMHGAVVNARAVIGENCILNSRCLIEHGAVVEDHCHVSTGAIINGDARIGSRTFVGSGALVRERIAVGSSCIVGMGQRVLRDCADGTHHYGVRGK